MTQSSPLINKNIVRQETHKYLFTSMVSHRGIPVSFAMRDNGQIYYSVLDLSSTEKNTNVVGEDKNNDKNYWSKVTFEGATASSLHFPTEISQIGYGVVPNFQIYKYDDDNKKIIVSHDSDGKPLDGKGNVLSKKAIDDKANLFYSSTARLGAKSPFQVLSDGKYIYVFRQSISANDANNETPAIVNNTLLVDRFILSGTILKRSREIRYQRSRQKTQPASKKDTLAATDIEGKPFYEPTRELAFANNLSNGNFSILLIPGADPEEQQWQIFTGDSDTQKINSFNIKFDPSIIFDTSDSQLTVDAFIQKYGLDNTLITSVQSGINNNENDASIYNTLVTSNNKYSEKNIPKDALVEIIYTIRTGVEKDGFSLGSMGEWPLIEYKGNTIDSKYLDGNGALQEKYTFHGPADELEPETAAFKLQNGLSSCYYYQQEMGKDNKPMKNKASVMLAIGLEDNEPNKYIGVLNFSVSVSGQLSRITTDAVNMPDINVQALDENPYRNLKALNSIEWQKPQKMGLIDIDPNGLSTSGGVLKFAYTSSKISENQGYSDAVEATAPYLFDDSLGRVNLYFKGKNDNFFVLYFNPTGSKGTTVTDPSSKVVTPELSLKPRLDRDMHINVAATILKNANTCTLSMTSKSEVVEKWNNLPQRFSQISTILNGNGELPLGTLEPLGNTKYPKAAYLKPTRGNGTLKIRTTTDNNLMFLNPTAFADKLTDGKTFSPKALSNLSTYLSANKQLKIAKKSFSLVSATVNADIIYKNYLFGMVDDRADADKLWGYLTKNLILQDPKNKEQGSLKSAAIKGTVASLKTILKDSEIKNLSLELLKEGNAVDIKARLAKLKESLIELILDVAKVRIVTFKVQDDNTQQVDRLDAGLAVSVIYDYQSQFTCNPSKLEGTSASKWEHNRSYLFNVWVNYNENTTTTTKITKGFNYDYDINNTIGQWENWDASLAMEMTPKSDTNGSALNTTDSEKLKAIQSTEKGLSIESWIKPSKDMTKESSILYYKKDEKHYALSIEKQDTDSYKCVATYGDKKYVSKNAFLFESPDKRQWRHLAFTHKKYWGYKLGIQDSINCGNDNSLQLNDDFTLEVSVQIDAAGTILEKEGEYKLWVNSNKEIIFDWDKKNCLEDWVEMGEIPALAQQNDKDNYKYNNGSWWKKSKPNALNSFNQFYKITIIRSKKEPDTKPSKAEYPITGGDQEKDGGPKWYENKNSDDLLKGMAEKQNQVDKKISSSQLNMLGDDINQSSKNPTYFYTLIVTKNDDNSIEWATKTAKKYSKVEAYKDFSLGGNNLAGTFASIRVWNRGLSKSEAKSLTIPGNKTGLISNWRITEGKGTYLYDNASENHGIATGGTWVDSPQSNQAGQFQFYVDGAPEENDTPTSYTAKGINQLSLGGIKLNDSSFNSHFKGTLEEIRIWDRPRTNEQITDNAFGRLKGEREQLLANYTFDEKLKKENVQYYVEDSSMNSVSLMVHNKDMLREVLSTAPVATEIPQVRSALTGVLTTYNDYIHSRPGIVEYGDVQKNDDGTLNGILKRCYSFIDADNKWNRMTGYKVGNLVSQWYGQAQFAPQVMGYLEGAPPVPAENFPVAGGSSGFRWNSVSFNQAEKVSFNYNTSKEAGWNVAVNSEMKAGVGDSILVAPLGFGLSFKVKAGLATKSNWETSGKRSQSFKRGTSVNTNRGFSARLAGYTNKSGAKDYYKMGNTGYALVKSKTADIYLLRLAHNHALVSISYQPNPDIPEDVNIIPFPINPLYTKQGTLDGKLGETTDAHYPQAQGAYGQYSYFKPREAYQLKKQIEREKMELKAYFEDSFDVSKTSSSFTAAAATTGAFQLAAFAPGVGPLFTSAFNQVAGRLATQIGYNNTGLKEDLKKMASQRNLVNTYIWTIEGGFYSESTEVAETQQETYSNTTSLALGGDLGVAYDMESGAAFEQKTMFSSGSSFTLTKSRTKESSTSFGLDVSVRIPTSPRYQYTGTDGRTLTDGLIQPGTVDAYRFMSFYLETKGQHFIDLFTKIIDPIWLDQSPDPNAQALRQARGNVSKPKSCWRIMHRVTYVSRILPKFKPQAPPSLEKSMRVAGIESNYMLIKKFEPYVAHISDSADFYSKIDEIINSQLPEFKLYKRQIKNYLALYFNIE